MSFAAVVYEATSSHMHHHGSPVQPNVIPSTDHRDDSNSNQPQIVDIPPSRSTHFRSPPDTPSGRTGPPRSLSYAYSLPNSATSRGNNENGHISGVIDDASFSPQSSFRSALEHGTPELDRKGKKRERLLEDRDNWNPMRWFHESPKDEQSGFDFESGDRVKTETGESKPTRKQSNATHDEEPTTPMSRKSILRRAFSVPHASSPEQPKPGRAKWSRLRSLIPKIIQHSAPVTSGPSGSFHTVHITDELITGGLSTLMLRLWFERDEKDHRRVPVLLHRLRIRVSDSLHPMHEARCVFRIECEYANGTARWVVYRQLRDFLSLHAHYTVSNVYNRRVQIDKLPEFPRTSMSIIMVSLASI